MRAVSKLIITMTAALAGFALQVQGGAEKFQDTILRTSGKHVTNIRVTEDSWRWLKAKTRSGQDLRPVPACEVASVEYDHSPAGLEAAVRDVKAGKSLEGLRALSALLADGKVKQQYPQARQYILYYAGRASLEIGISPAGKKEDIEKAVGLFEQLLSEVPDSRFMFGAMTGVGKGYFALGEWDKAKRAYGKAVDKAGSAVTSFTGGMVDHLKRISVRAQLMTGRVLERQGDAEGARQTYRVLLSKSRTYPGLFREVQAAVGNNLVLLKQYDKAIEHFKSLIEKAEDEGDIRVLGEAYLGLADSYFAKEDFRPARWNYKRVIVQYPEDRLLPRAHYGAGLCYERIGSADKEKRWRKQAARHFRKVLERFPDTEWGKKAREGLGRVGG